MYLKRKILTSSQMVEMAEILLGGALMILSHDKYLIGGTPFYGSHLECLLTRNTCGG